MDVSWGTIKHEKTAQDNGYPPVLKMGIYAIVIINQIYIMGIYWPRSLSWDIEPAKQGLECGGYSMEHITDEIWVV